MLIIKFGGSSVGSVQNLHRVKAIAQSKKEHFVMVVSAFSQVTNQLQELGELALTNQHQTLLEEIKERHISTAKELITVNHQTNSLIDIQQHFLELGHLCESVHILGELSEKTKARILSKGELLSSKIIANFLNQEGVPINYLDARKVIQASGNFLNAVVDFDSTYANCEQFVDQSKNYIVPGFISGNELNETLLLGRGGSDYTASIFGAGTNSTKIELWSDVNGMQSANPKLVKNAQVINKMSYEEAFEMSYFGAKVVFPPAIKPAMQKQIPVWLKNTMRPEDIGTEIRHQPNDRGNKVLGVSTLNNISVVNITGVGLAGAQGSARKIFQALEFAGVNVVLISQSCSEQSICIGINSADSKTAYKALTKQFDREIERNLINDIEITDNNVILALVGDNMKHQVGLTGKIFGALGENNVNVIAIAQGASERNISVVINEKDEHKAINVIHERFFQDAVKKVHLFVIGVGNVGKQFVDIVDQQREHCKANHKVELRVVSVANSKQYLYNDQGLASDEISTLKENGTAYSSIEELRDFIKEQNLRNTIVIDNTASKEVSEQYISLFKDSISIVTCNKIAGSSPLSNYNKVIDVVKNGNCYFQYETSVGAALPVIKTIQDLKLSGDTIHHIQAVLSGSLNFIFNNYDGSKPFHEIVKQAQDEGYTEPDPRIDLSGLDVIRKILILAREAGYYKEIDEVTFKSFLPEAALKTDTVADFYEVLKNNEDFFQNMLANAKANNAKLKVIAEMDEGNLKVSLQEVPATSPFFNLDGKDNIVALTTQLYTPEPLIVKGAGAGAKVTASGVFQDLMYIVNQR